MNYPTESETWARNDTTNTAPYELIETLTDAAMRELRAAVAEYTCRAVTAEAELAQARRLLRELWNDTGALSAGASSDVAERVSDELNKE